MNSDKDQRELRQGLRDQLLERLKSNLTEYFDSLRNDANLSLGGAAPEIAAVFGAYHYITEQYGYTDSQMRYLLLFQNFRGGGRVSGGGHRRSRRRNV